MNNDKKNIDPLGRAMGDRINKVRRQKKDTIVELAKYLDLSDSFVRDFLKGRRRAAPEYLIKIAERYNISMDYIAGFTDDPRQLWNNDNISSILRMTAKMSNEDLRKAAGILDLIFIDDDLEVPSGNGKTRQLKQTKRERKKRNLL